MYVRQAEDSDKSFKVLIVPAFLVSYICLLICMSIDMYVCAPSRGLG